MQAIDNRYKVMYYLLVMVFITNKGPIKTGNFLEKKLAGAGFLSCPGKKV
jgi:hypothetical protein